MDIPLGMGMIRKAIEKERERRHWEQWLAKYPFMDKKSFVPYNQFYKPPRQAEAAVKSAPEILADVESILASMRKEA